VVHGELNIEKGAEVGPFRPLPTVGWKERLLFAFGRRQAFRVEGDSMLPGLRNGDVVLVDPRSAIGPGDIVVALHPFKKGTKVVKRVSQTGDDGRSSLLGDNPDESSDSRSFGTVGHDGILGKAVAKLRSTIDG